MEEFFNRMDTKTKFYCSAITFLILSATAVVALSFGTIEPTEYGLTYNSVSKNINQGYVYEGGLQYTGLFNSILRFPKIHKSIEFSDTREANAKALSTRTKEGLELQLHFAF